jgi:hypothetical protein
MYLLGVKPCPTTIRGRAADTCKRAEALHGESPTMSQTTFTIAALFVVFTIAALIVFSAITMGAVAGA